MLTGVAERGFTLVEVTMALTLLIGGLLGLGATMGTVLQRSRAAELEHIALQAVQDRLEIIRLDLAYLALDSLYTGSETMADDLTGYTRTTVVDRTITPMPGDRVVDFTEITVRVSGPGLAVPVARTAIVGAP